MKIAGKGQETEVRLEGIINEFSVMHVADIPSGRTVVLDTGEVTAINSLGVRNWLVFMDALSRRASRLVIRRLATPLVLQTAAIRDFLGRAHIESFMAPWFCPVCERTVEFLHRVGEEIRPHPCPKCGKAMVLDDLPDWYATLSSGSAGA